METFGLTLKEVMDLADTLAGGQRRGSAVIYDPTKRRDDDWKDAPGR